tara:strand:- start:190 stop:900 length:711 start_codon:yes stop_codon:yes gene_type:complete
MSLPKLKTPTYEFELPSTGEKIKYRPFLVKEQKILMVASESEEETQMRDAIIDIISACTFNKIEAVSLPMFDIEMLFLKIRGKSVGEKIDVNIKCPDDEKTVVAVTIDLADIEVQVDKDHKNVVDITENIKINMRYPTLNDMFGMSGIDTSEVENIMSLIKKCVHEVHDGETVHTRIDMSESDLDEFIESLTTDQFSSLSNFFESMPKVAHSIEVTNPNTKKKGVVVIQGIQSFFE